MGAIELLGARASFGAPKAHRCDFVPGNIVAIVHTALLVVQLTLTLYLVTIFTGDAPLPSGFLDKLSRHIASAQQQHPESSSVLGRTVDLSALEKALHVPSPAIPAADPGSSTGSIGHVYGLNGSLLPTGFKTFETILKASQSTKNWHNMGHMYSEYLDPMRLQQKEVNMLEIGLQFGASLDLWFSAFPRGKVYGLEYNKLALKAAPGDVMKQRATIFRGDQSNVTLLREISKKVKGEVGLLDFIVDDGGHSMEQQIASFTHLMPLVRPGGLYFIEDLQTSYWSRCHRHWNKEQYCYGGGPLGKKKTTIDMIKSFIDVLNGDFIENHRNRDKLGTGKYSVNPSDKLIASVQCWRNMCVFRRKFKDSHF